MPADAPRAPTRLYTRPFLGTTAINLLSFGQWFSLNPVLPLVILELGGDAAVAGLAFAFFSIPSLIFRPIFGALSDRLGTRLILLASTLGIGLAAPFYLVPSLAFMMLVRVVHGIAWAAVMTVCPALMARQVPASRRGEAASIYDLMPSLAQMAMPAIGLLIWTAGGGLAVFALGTALGVGAWLVVLATSPRDAPIARPAATTGRLPILEPSAILPMIIVVLFMSAAPLFVIYPPILATENNIPLTDLAIYYPVFGIAMVGSRILVSKIIDRLPRLELIIGGALLAIAALVGSILATSIVALTVAGALYGGAIGVLVPAITAAVMDRAPPGRMGSAMGTYTLGFQFAGGFGAALWGFVISSPGSSRPTGSRSRWRRCSWPSRLATGGTCGGPTPARPPEGRPGSPPPLRRRIRGVPRPRPATVWRQALWHHAAHGPVPGCRSAVAWTHSGEAVDGIGERVREILVEGGVSLAVYLPDSVLHPLTAAIEAEPAIRTMVCSREDEGMAIAAGASLAGGLPIVLMEGSGVGFSGLILARSQVQRSGFLVVASHSPALGERFDYHAASRQVGAGVLGGLGIPYVIPRSADELLVCLRQGLETVVGQRSVVGVLVPPFVLS